MNIEMNFTKKVQELCLKQTAECEESDIEFKLPWLRFLQSLTILQSNKYASHIKDLGSIIKKLNWNDVTAAEVEILLDFLTSLFVSVDPKEGACRAVIGILQGLSDSHHSIIVNKMANHLGNAISSVPNTDKELIQNVLAMLQAHLANFPIGEDCVKLQIVLVLKFLAKSLSILVLCSRSENSAVHQSQAMHQCLVLVKTGLTVIQKCSLPIAEKIGKKCGDAILFLESLLSQLASILKTDSFLAECRSASGMLFALICKTWCSGSDIANLVASPLFKHSSTPVAEPSHLQQLIVTFDLVTSSDLSHLYLCHGFLVMLDPMDLIKDLGDGSTILLDVLFPHIYQLTQSLENSSTSLAAARSLCQWVDVTESIVRKMESSPMKTALSGPSPIPQKLIQYVTTHWDHPVDGIRHQTKSIFEGVMKIHLQTLKGVPVHEDPFTLATLSTLLNTDWHTRGKYGPLGCLCEMIGTTYVIKLYPHLLHQLLDVMGEHAMATHSCEVIEKLFTHHKREHQQSTVVSSLSWNETWVIPILDVMSDQSKPVKQKGFLIDYLIPKLLKCSPPSLAFIIQHLSSESRSNTPREDSSHTQSLHDNASSVSGSCYHGNRESSDAGRLGALLSCLKTARSMGLLSSGHDGKRIENMMNKEEKTSDFGDDDRSKKEEVLDEAKEGVQLWKGLVPVRLLYQALCHSINQIRIDAIGLLCDSHKTTEEVTEMDISLLTFSLPFNLNNPSPSFRQQFISHIKKLLVRMRESGRILRKQSHKAKDKDDHQSVLLLKYQDFLQWLCTVMFQSLGEGFGYARRATSLHILTAIHATFPSNDKGVFETSRLWSARRVDLMVARLTDNYESNRIMAFDLLVSLPQDTLGLQNPKDLEDRYRVANDLAISNRPYNCETAGYVFRLLVMQTHPSLHSSLSPQTTEVQSQARLDTRSSVEASTLCVIQNLCDALARQTKVAKESLLEAVVQGPMYGVLHCMRILLADTDLKTLQMVEQWRCVVETIFQLCFDVAEVSATVVCNSSPEGFIPSEQKQVNEDESSSQTSPWQQEGDATRNRLETYHVTPQMILVCCWRSMKEVSLLLGELCQRAPMENEDRKGLVTIAQVKSIGHFFMKLLRESKHRGAFELAYSGFIKLTTRIWSEPSSIHDLPQKWLSELLGDITSNQSTLCATRRSAGIPFAIQALIGPEPKELGKPCFQTTMTTLLSLALPSTQCQEHTAQVHALNILRALFRDNRLGQEVLPFIGDGVKAAILGFAAKLWAVRNSATMLFSSLISRIFGVKRARDELARKNCMTGTEFFSHFPSLHGFLLEQFEHAYEAEKASKPGVTVLHPSLFPSLLLLSRLYPSPNDASNTSMSMAPFLPHVIRAGCSAVCKTRSIAATALVPLVPPNQLVNTLHHLLDRLMGAANHPHPCTNTIHGILMQIHCLLEKYSKDTALPQSILADITSTVLPRLQKLLWLASRQNKSYITRTAFTVIIKDFFVDTKWLHTTTATSSKVDDATFTSTGATLQEGYCGSLLRSMSNLVKEEISDGRIHETSSSSCPGFPMWQAAFASLCLKLWGYLVTGCKPPSPHGSHQELGQYESRTVVSKLDLPNDLHCYFLQSSFPEVRMTTLTHLIRVLEQSTCIGSNGSAGDAKICLGVLNKQLLMKALMDIMVSEEDHECLSKTCKALSLVLPMVMAHELSVSPSSALGIDPKMFLTQCLHLADQNDTREEILGAIVSLTGAVLPFVIDSSPQDDLPLLQKWTSLLKSCSQSERSSQLRLAVAKLFDYSSMSLLGIPRIHHADMQVSLWGITMALLQDDHDDVRHTAARCVLKTAHLMQDLTEFTTEPVSFLGKLNTVLTDVDPCDNNEMEGPHCSSDWSVLLGLNEGHVTMETMKALTEPYRRVYDILHSNQLDLISWDLHPCLLVHVAPYLLSCLYLKENPSGCLATLINWAKEGARDIAPTSTNEEDSEEHLFDKGESNTNYEDIPLRLASYLQLCRLRAHLWD